MTQIIQAIRGMNDLLPEEIPYWHFLEKKLRMLADSYGYQEIRLPILEHAELYQRSIGDMTDIVEKEMYTFIDRNQESLTMRPEGTAGCVRAAIQHGMLHNQTQRLWYSGPIFRHERPQKGRYRQFYQFGVEALGFAGPAIDAEIIMMSARLWQQLGLTDMISLELNSLGSMASRHRYREALINYFSQHRTQLDADSERRLHTNPLRILDSKNPTMQSLISEAPALTDYLDEQSQRHFSAVCDYLASTQIRFTTNPRLVRGLDYYTDTVFEWATGALGAQGTVCAGGRYDGLVSQLGGAETPAVGFALGMERLILLLQQQINVGTITAVPDAFLIVVGDKAIQKGLQLAEQLHDQLPNFKIVNNISGGSFKSQFKRADKSGAQLALIVAEDEIKNNTVSIKFLREQTEQQTVSESALVNVLMSFRSDKMIRGKLIS